MIEVMRKGQISCECGNEFYFESIREAIPCMKCGKMHPNNGDPVPENQTESSDLVEEDV